MTTFDRPRACRYCGVSDPVLLHRLDIGDVMRCALCDMAFLANVGPPSDVYGLSYFASEDSRVGYRDYLGAELAERQAVASEFASQIAEVTKLDAASRILDVGAGPGLFVRAFRDCGFECEGLEPAADVAAFGRSRFGAPLHACTLRDYAASRAADETGFDLITLFDVIEHFERPAAALATLQELLTPAGLVFVSTPRFDGVLYARQGADYVQFKREHLWYFSERALQRLLADAGLRASAIFTGSRFLALTSAPNVHLRRKYLHTREHLFVFASFNDRARALHALQPL